MDRTGDGKGLPAISNTGIPRERVSGVKSLQKSAGRDGQVREIPVARRRRIPFSVMPG